VPIHTDLNDPSKVGAWEQFNFVATNCPTPTTYASLQIKIATAGDDARQDE